MHNALVILGYSFIGLALVPILAAGYVSLFGYQDTDDTVLRIGMCLTGFVILLGIGITFLTVS